MGFATYVLSSVREGPQLLDIITRLKTLQGVDLRALITVAERIHVSGKNGGSVSFEITDGLLDPVGVAESNTAHT